MKRNLVVLGCALALGGTGWTFGSSTSDLPREVFWGTPNFSYGAAFMPPPKLREAGVTYMSHLIYWNQWEVAPGTWNESYINSHLALIDAMAAAGIVSGIRLGEAHPGARVWKTEDGKPYEGRNAACYPGNEDTDERFFQYVAKLAGTLKGKVDHYVLGDELDMIYGASYRDEEKLFEYFKFFTQAAKVIRQEDPGAKIVVFPFAWGHLARNIALLHKWGLELHADGVSFNIAANDCVTPAYLADMAVEIRAISPKYKLYSNGFGYISDTLTEEGQAWRLAHTMFSIWEAGWIFAPYYLLASNTTPWSDGLYREDLASGGIVKRKGADVFQRLGERLKRKPRIDPQAIRVTGFMTPVGEVAAEEFPDAKIRCLWQADEEHSFGLLTTERMNDPRIFRTIVTLNPVPTQHQLAVENVITGEMSYPDLRIDPVTGAATAVIEVTNEPQILTWVPQS